MKINSIALDKNELPQTITATLSLDEIVVLARWTGGLSGLTSPAPVVTSGIYDALVGGVVNRFWDDGINDLAHIATDTQEASA